jgi:hypothetical protein
MIKPCISRGEAVDLLRERFSKLVDDDHSLCEVASRHQVFCKGFAQWNFDELKKRYEWLVETNPATTRGELEFRANAWQLARQQLLDTTCPCDTQEREHDTCFGWDEFTVEQLEVFLRQLAEVDVEVTPGGERE